MSIIYDMIDSRALIKCFRVENITCTCYFFALSITHHAEQFGRAEGSAVANGLPARPEQVKVMQQGQGQHTRKARNNKWTKVHGRGTGRPKCGGQIAIKREIETKTARERRVLFTCLGHTSAIRHFSSETARHYFTFDRGTMHLISVTSVEEEMPAKTCGNKSGK